IGIHQRIDLDAYARIEPGLNDTWNIRIALFQQFENAPTRVDPGNFMRAKASSWSDWAFRTSSSSRFARLFMGQQVCGRRNVDAQPDRLAGGSWVLPERQDIRLWISDRRRRLPDGLVDPIRREPHLPGHRVRGLVNG